MAATAPAPSAGLRTACLWKRSPRNATKRSPARSVRVSVETPVKTGAPPRVRPSVESAASRRLIIPRSCSSARSFRASSGERRPRDRGVGERQALARDLLIIFVPFARDEHHIGGPGAAHRVLDRAGAIPLDPVSAPHPPFGLRDDREPIPAPRRGGGDRHFGRQGPGKP